MECKVFNSLDSDTYINPDQFRGFSNAAENNTNTHIKLFCKSVLVFPLKQCGFSSKMLYEFVSDKQIIRLSPVEKSFILQCTN